MNDNDSRERRAAGFRVAPTFAAIAAPRYGDRGVGFPDLPMTMHWIMLL
jgi:hypothetical protein